MNALLHNLHTQYYGIEDDYIHNAVFCPFEPTNIFSNNLSQIKSTHSSSEKEIRHIISNPTDDTQFAYIGFSAHPPESVKRIRLEIGGQCIEQNSRFKYLGMLPEFYLMSNGRAIPHLSEHQVHFIVDLTDDAVGEVTLSYERLAIEGNHTPHYEILYYNEHANHYVVKPGKNEIKMELKHPVVEILLYVSTDNINDIRILLDDNDYGLLLTKKGNYYTFSFNPSLNFSRIEKAILQITIDDNASNDSYDVVLLSIEKRILQINNGACSVVFS